MKYFVYALTDPRKNNDLFYIGKGCGRRPRHHLRSCAKGDNKFKQDVISAIRKTHQEPGTIVLFNQLEEHTAYEIEAQLISLCGRRIDGGRLTNMCLDARPPNRRGKPHSTATRAKMKAAALAHTRTPEHCANISKSKSGNLHPRWGQSLPAELREKIRRGNLGVTRSVQVRQNMAAAHGQNYEATSPQGKCYHINTAQLKELCFANDLHQGSFMNAKRASVAYKGWQLRDV